MRALFVLAAALLLILPGRVSGAGAGAPDAGAKKRCRVAIKVVHGHRTRVRVCQPRPKPKPVPHFVKRVDVGGYRLAIACTGTGSPAIVLDSGFGTSRSAWAVVMRRLRFRTIRVCAYDRAGLGQSDERPDGVTPTTARIIDELHTLLAGAGIPPPYVLGGWSIGGFDVRYYTKRYPGDVAGLVLVDASPPVYLLNAPEPLESGFETMYTHEAARELEPPPDLGALPLVVLVRGILDDVVWLVEQKLAARTSTNSIIVRARGASHDIPGDNPALVAVALKLVLGVVRGGEPLPACADTGLPKYRGTCLSARSA